MTPTTASFDKYTSNQADIPVTVTLNGNVFNGIKNGTTTLVAGTDYIISGNTVTISKSYLAKQSTGTTKLTFDFSAGADPVLTITITDSTPSASISLTAAEFDKGATNPEDIVVILTLNDHSFVAIKNGSNTLTQGVDYTVSGNTVTILNSYLANQAIGKVNLIFQFSAGNDATLTVTVKDSSIVVSGDIKIQMFNGNTSATTNGIAPRIKLSNTGTSAIALSDVVLRYYYTIDGEKVQNFWCDWSSAGSSNVTGKFVKLDLAKTDADYYLEIGFTSGAGTLAAGGSIEVQVRFSKADWTNYTQTEDYSFSSTNSSYVDWEKMTGYVGGNLAWGVEP
ncbi:X2-like carbohydrate binding domain-containing protein [Clostridium sp. Marseille-P299]|uniref:X2-like carbohydrate binding domain-containing protein n=1 Tax=Clostridium sp. Marseille-P299 TaxID=1805477 RepID=UPI001FA7C6CA|nr:X2-like carbohydrate binding domain-containing protein [Clostridium sp. Marseille-P299]